MRNLSRHIGIILILAVTASQLGCGATLFSGKTAKQSAIQAIVTTTKSVTLAMTSAGIAYNLGFFGQPGSPKAEETWAKIAAQSRLAGQALTEWDAAIRANKDASAYQSIVSQALAVLTALLPAPRSEFIGDEMRELMALSVIPTDLLWDRLAHPDSFRRQPTTVLAGGAQ